MTKMSLQYRSPPSCKPNEDRCLAVTPKRNRRSRASNLSRQISAATGMTVSKKSVNRRLGRIGLYSRFSLKSDSHRTFIWRTPGTRHLQGNIIEVNGYNGIVRVQYFVRGGFVGRRSRASSKHLSPHLPVDELDSSGVKKGLRCTCKMHVWVSGPTKDADSMLMFGEATLQLSPSLIDLFR
ncbi:transposable element Tcb1 transposase [Trichonephila clavipes]|nr:transposable element Tcb1 transposase [Trichonephila clavipes]